MSKYKHIFFDLDRTLWDFEQNATETLMEMYVEEKLNIAGIPNQDEFIRVYRLFNRDLWQQFKDNKISKDYLKTERFYRTLKHFGVEDYSLGEKLGKQYIAISPTKKKLFPYSIEILEYLKKYYQLHIITNGFKEVQFVKLEHSGLSPFFKEVITSEDVGYKKPDSRIFDFAIQKANASKNESLMIGDDAEADITGAQNAGIDQVYVNYHHSVNGVRPTFEVNSLEEIEKIL
jgi:putative hydrolase of the HAD superfamily